MRRSISIPALVAAAALVLAGCGDSGSGARLDNAEFVSRADDVCAEASTDLEELVEEHLDENVTPSGVQRWAEASVSRLNRLIADLERLRPPAEKEADYRRYLEGFERLRDAIQRASTSETAAERLFTEEDPFPDADELTQKLGLDECAAA